MLHFMPKWGDTLYVYVSTRLETYNHIRDNFFCLLTHLYLKFSLVTSESISWKISNQNRM